jgi:hypothetical protein
VKTRKLVRTLCAITLHKSLSINSYVGLGALGTPYDRTPPHRINH